MPEMTVTESITHTESLPTESYKQIKREKETPEPVLTSSLTDDDYRRLELDRQTYDKIALEQSLALDKSIITIAGTSFSVAIAFIDKIIFLEKALFLYSFWISLSFLAVAIIITTLSFWFSEQATSYARKNIDDYEKTQNINDLYKKNPWLSRLQFTNNARIVSFVFGMALLAFFIFINGMNQSYSKISTKNYQEESMSDKKNNQPTNTENFSGTRGQLPPSPRGPKERPSQQSEKQPSSVKK